jgi:hypothetical protein
MTAFDDTEPPHDILAAEAFELGTGDPGLRTEPVHDVLAAEEFELGTGDPALRRAPLRLPDEPYPAAEAHDVLAAEEFALPAGRVGSTLVDAMPDGGRDRVLVAGGLLAAAVAMWRRRRR